MDSFEAHLNDLLMSTYRSLEMIEQKMLRDAIDFNLTISEVHLLEAAGQPVQGSPGKTVREISQLLGIRPPSVTMGINKLVDKGYVIRQKSETDGRVVYISLTRLGQKAEHAHRYFHRNMIHSITAEMTCEEKDALLNGIIKLNDFFTAKLQKSGGHA